MHGIHRGHPERHHPLLGALAGDDHREPLEVDIVDVEPDQFGDTECAGIEKLDHGTVAERLGVAGRRALLQRLEDVGERGTADDAREP